MKLSFPPFPKNVFDGFFFGVVQSTGSYTKTADTAGDSYSGYIPETSNFVKIFFDGKISFPCFKG